ncbi:hypothetical protein RRSWK_04712 [Rhodopirellula sp. SWK7]|nr:hypothetical protein RRSWK_04712 [Rhodopirellula sp. SWK7]
MAISIQNNEAVVQSRRVIIDSWEEQFRAGQWKRYAGCDERRNHCESGKTAAPKQASGCPVPSNSNVGSHSI